MCIVHLKCNVCTFVARIFFHPHAPPNLHFPRMQGQLTWQKQRLYVLAKAHALLATAVAATRTRAEATFSLALTSQAAAFLWDHHLSGTPCLPAGALLELAAAATLAAHTEQSRSILLYNAAIAAVVALPESLQQVPVLTCTVQLRTGGVAVYGAQQSVMTVVVQPPAMEAAAGWEPSSPATRSALVKVSSASLVLLFISRKRMQNFPNGPSINPTYHLANAYSFTSPPPCRLLGCCRPSLPPPPVAPWPAWHLPSAWQQRHSTSIPPPCKRHCCRRAGTAPLWLLPNAPPCQAPHAHPLQLWQQAAASATFSSPCLALWELP